MVFPARLELNETQRGLFQVQFNLPVQNMARIKATPVLPAVCAASAPPKETTTESSYAAIWEVNCPADALPGQSIGVDGLLGSRTDVLLSIKTLDGRQYRAVLKPARGSYVIPRPPSFVQIHGQGLVEAMRASFVRIDLFLLTWLLVLLSSRRRSAITALMMGGIAYAVAQALAQDNLLLVPASLPGLLVLMSCVYFAIRLAAGGDSVQKRRVPVWLAGVLIGALYCSALQGFAPAQELSRFEHATAFIAQSLGIMVGLLVIYWLCVELKQVLRLIPGLRQDTAARRILGTLTGIAALGLLLYQLSAYSLWPTLAPTAPLIFFVVAAILGIYAARAETDNLLRWSVAGLLLVAGLITGALGHRLPYDSVVVPLTLFALGTGLASKRGVPHKVTLVIIALAALYSSGQTGLFIQENLSGALGHLAGNGLLAAFVFLAAFIISARQDSRFSPGIRIVGGIGAAVALLVWGQGYLGWLHTTFASDYAMGMVRIPLLSLVLVLMAMVIWPRRSKVAAFLNTEIRKPIAHVVFLVLALFLLNVGTVQTRNPLHDQDAPDPEQAKRILETVLGNTYSAFNQKDEELLYQQLSENVGDELVEDLYLDSRRRLTSGVRQGSEVTVKDVSVLNVDPSLGQGSDVSNRFAYEVEWVVTARVRHLQHVHHRKNMYTGVLTIQVNDGKWTVQQVDLKSEERAIVPGGST